MQLSLLSLVVAVALISSHYSLISFELKIKNQLKQIDQIKYSTKEELVTRLVELETFLFGPFYQKGRWNTVTPYNWNNTFVSWLTFVNSFPNILFLIFNWESWKYAIDHVIFYSKKMSFSMKEKSPVIHQLEKKKQLISQLIERIDLLIDNIKDFILFLIAQRIKWKRVINDKAVDKYSPATNQFNSSTVINKLKESTFVKIFQFLIPNSSIDSLPVSREILHPIKFDWFDRPPIDVLLVTKKILEIEMKSIYEWIGMVELFNDSVVRRWFRNILLQKASKLTWQSIDLPIQSNLANQLTSDEERKEFEKYTRDFLKI